MPEPIIKLSGISMRWENHLALHDINLDINRGDFIAITGPNGGGKTTLLRIILKLITPTTGTVTYMPDETGHQKLSIGYLPQKNMIDSRFPITVREVIRMGLIGDRNLSPDDAAQRVTQIISTVGLEEHAQAGLGTLSGGQLQRALLGRALISSPEVLVLDEPLSYVDRHFEQRIYDIISNLPKLTTIILVSHDMSTIASMANRHIIVNGTLECCHSGNHFAHYDCCDHPEHSLLHR